MDGVCSDEATTIEVVVEDDCSKTVARVLIIRPTTGFVSSPNNCPAVHLPMTLAPEPSSSSPKRKKYINEQTNRVLRKR
jgi:hypothetical protein